MSTNHADASPPESPHSGGRVRWLNSTVLGIGLASLLSDWSHETATTILPAFLATLGAGAAWVGIIEGVADGLSSFAKLISGHWTDRLKNRKPVTVAGYAVTALATASFAWAATAWQVLLGRTIAWLGRGVRTPLRKAVLAAATPPEAYGRAFGFERMMDTLGAIIGPATAYFLLHTGHTYPQVFAWTLVPGLAATAAILFLVHTRGRSRVKYISFGENLRGLPARYRKFLIACGLFGLGSFSHTLLILLATKELTPTLGPAKAATIAVALYILHNVFYSAFAYISGWMGDHLPKAPLLAFGFVMAALMSICIIFLPVSIPALALIFALGGTSVAFEETIEDSLSAELVEESHHGMAFGVLASVNGVGDFVSSAVVGILWSAIGPGAAFGYSLVLFAAAIVLVLQLRPRADLGLPHPP